jgi:hypothetical protein
MTSKLINGIAVFCLFINSCSMPECRNINPVFENFTPESPTYKKELAKQIRSIGSHNVSYWHDKYLMKGTAEYIVVNVQGKDLCATLEIQVADWRKINSMRQEASGYSGAKLVGLDFEIVEDSTGAAFLFRDVDRIVD